MDALGGYLTTPKDTTADTMREALLSSCAETVRPAVPSGRP
jgi:hypothetical protein